MPGGRKPEEFPDAVRLDEQVIHYLRTMTDPFRDPSGLSRNELAALTGRDRKKIRYSLNRLRKRGLAKHVRKGNEGHGYWAVTETETETDDQRAPSTSQPVQLPDGPVVRPGSV